jgi:hypothetical protein
MGPRRFRGYWSISKDFTGTDIKTHSCEYAGDNGKLKRIVKCEDGTIHASVPSDLYKYLNRVL